MRNLNKTDQTRGSTHEIVQTALPQILPRKDIQLGTCRALWEDSGVDGDLQKMSTHSHGKLKKNSAHMTLQDPCVYLTLF